MPDTDPVEIIPGDDTGGDSPAGHNYRGEWVDRKAKLTEMWYLQQEGISVAWGNPDDETLIKDILQEEVAATVAAEMTAT